MFRLYRSDDEVAPGVDRPERHDLVHEVIAFRHPVEHRCDVSVVFVQGGSGCQHGFIVRGRRLPLDPLGRVGWSCNLACPLWPP